MKFIFSFLITMGAMFGFTPEAKAHTVKTTVVERCAQLKRDISLLTIISRDIGFMGTTRTLQFVEMCPAL